MISKLYNYTIKLPIIQIKKKLITIDKLAAVPTKRWLYLNSTLYGKTLDAIGKIKQIKMV